MSRRPYWRIALALCVAAFANALNWGLGVHWPDSGEDISATGMLYGIPARPRKASACSKRSQHPDQSATTAPI